MSDLIEFLRARIGEDEQAARNAAEDGHRDWKYRDHESDHMVRDGNGDIVIYDEGRPSDDQAAHITRWDPARVLREVEAKKELLREYEESVRYYNGNPWPAGEVTGLRKAVEIAASVHGGHPDYDERWRP